MCLIAFSFKSHSKYPLVLAANRDEFYERPTKAAHFWEDEPNILAGRDLKAGGTWMGISRTGRFAAITNYRDLQNSSETARSRGEIPVEYLKGNTNPRKFLEDLHDRADQYNGFNVLLFDGDDMFHYSNYERCINQLAPGIYGLSNALLDTPWPKVNIFKKHFREALTPEIDDDRIMAALKDESLAADENLPDTGVGYALEKMLSAICIRSEKYGTCCSTLVKYSTDGQIDFQEHTYPVGDREEAYKTYKWLI